MSGINLWEVGGLIAALLGLLLYGRHLGKKSAEDKIIKAEAKKRTLEIQNSVAKTANTASVESAKAQADAKVDYQNSHKDIEQARKTNDEAAPSKIAAESAQKAIEKGAIGK